METVYLFLVGILFLFAFFDLIVGVSNDAVNFLNSAIGSKVAPRKVIFRVASAGILMGALFSSGMMEVARKGIFHPDMFVYRELMAIFLAVMITDVLLLDAYNTLKLPTSTTVSIVFELLGASVAVAFWKVSQSGDEWNSVMQYINSEKAFVIVSGILLSVVISFTVGLIVQWVTRYIFTFQYKEKIQRYGALFGGIAITAITYFLLLKGLKGTGLISKEHIVWLKENVATVVAILLVFWTLLIQILKTVRKFDVLKGIVLIGTFALAMAFAGNDLVNFIGVPIAGRNAFNIFSQTGDINMLMTDMVGKVPTPYFFLIVAGIVMVLTLWFSKKAKSVTDTEIGLAKASVGDERFGASALSRILVRGALICQKIIPSVVRSHIEKRFKNTSSHHRKNAPAFDLLRASVNLTVASILIAIATSMKLPLSTTYVTFMVAMGTSLADGVRGRDSAVYRITGVLAVIGGWFMTALIAFVGSAIIASLIYFGGYFAVFGLAGLAGLIIWKTHVHHGKLSKQQEEKQRFVHTDHETLSTKASYYIENILLQTQSLFKEILQSIRKSDRKSLEKCLQNTKEVREETRMLKMMVHNVFLDLPEEALEKGNRYVRIIVYLRKISHALHDIAFDSFTYLNNEHPPLIDNQVQELLRLETSGLALIGKTIEIIENNDLDLEVLNDMQIALENEIQDLKKLQLLRIKHNDVGVRNTTLYLAILQEVENISVFLRKMMKSYELLNE